MKQIDCEFEPEVLAAVLQSQWPDRVDPELRSHVSVCRICSDVAVIADAFGTARDATRASAVIPDSGRVWWMSQLRARREAIQSANRPITIAQAVALACAIGVIGACLGATSAWFQSALHQVAAEFVRVGMKGGALIAADFLVRHGFVILGLTAVLIVIPAAFLLAVGKDASLRR